jgi:alpha-beta hydrolase superfamily lysophospholipase
LTLALTFTLPSLLFADGKGSLELFIGGKSVGIEKWTEETVEEHFVRESVIVEMKLQQGGFDIELEQEAVVTLKGDPLETTLFAMEATANKQKQSLNLTLKDDTAVWALTIGETRNDGEIDIPKGRPVVVVENNASYRFRRLALLAPEGGETKLTVISPTLLQVLEATVTDRGRCRLKRSDDVVDANLYVITLSTVGIRVYLDDDNNLLLVDNPMQNFRAAAAGYATATFLDVEPEVEPALKAEEVSVPSGDITLAGTLTLPNPVDEPVPGILLLNGSGAQDRDGNTPGVDLKINIQKTLAETLTGAGFAVLRLDDRGIGGSESSLLDASLEDLVSDAEAAIAWMEAQESISSVGVIGHSEGGVIAIKAALRDGATLKWLALMASPAIPLDQLVLRQVRDRMEGLHLEPEAVDAAVKKQKDKFAEIRDGNQERVELLGTSARGDWVRQHMAFSPKDRIDRVTVPILVLQGMKDKQVYPDQAKLLEHALRDRDDVTVKRFDDLDHLFMKSTGDIGEYSDPTRTLDDQFLEELTGWIEKHSASPED